MADLPAQRHLILILARNFASRLATAVFLVDADGTVIYFNEAAERLLGQRFIEGHGMRPEEYIAKFAPRSDDGVALPFDRTPLGVAITRREPAHATFAIRGGDEVDRRIEVTAFPLLAHAGDLVGAITFFWEGA